MGALLKIREAGFVVTLVGDKLSVHPASLLTQDQRKFLKAHKAEIINDLATNDNIPNAPAAEPNVNQSLTCKGCIHFESYHDHGGGAGTCKAGVMPFGACWWCDTVHSCDEYQSSVNSHADPEPVTDPLLVEVWTPSGTAMMIRADSSEYADWLRNWLRKMNPKPKNPALKPDPTPEYDADRISETEHNAQGRFFKFMITRKDGSQFFSCSMPRMTLAEVREQCPDAAAIEPVTGEYYPND